MNTPSINTFTAPYQFLPRNFHRYVPVSNAENSGIQGGGPETNQLVLMGRPEKTQASSVSQQQGVSAQIKQTAEIDVTTKEGDVIKIRLDQSATSSQAAVNISQDGNSTSLLQSNSDSNFAFSVSVDGNLNEDEQKSLKTLLNQMSQVGQDFFKGNTQEAFNHVQQIGLDTQQIASFSMSLSTEKSVQAIAAYQQAGLPDQQVKPEQLKQTVDFFSHAMDLLKSAQSALEPFKNPMSAFNDLFNAIQQVGIEQNTGPKAIADNATLQQIIKPLGEAVLQNDRTVQA